MGFIKDFSHAYFNIAEILHHKDLFGISYMLHLKNIKKVQIIAHLKLWQ